MGVLLVFAFALQPRGVACHVYHDAVSLAGLSPWPPSLTLVGLMSMKIPKEQSLRTETKAGSFPRTESEADSFLSDPVEDDADPDFFSNLMKQWADSYRNKDFETLQSMYSEQAVLSDPDKLFVIGTANSPFYQGEPYFDDLELMVNKTIVASPYLAHSVYLAKWGINSFKGYNRHEKTDDGWKITADISPLGSYGTPTETVLSSEDDTFDIVKEHYDSYVANYNAKDFAAARALYAPNAIISDDDAVLIVGAENLPFLADDAVEAGRYLTGVNIVPLQVWQESESVIHAVCYATFDGGGMNGYSRFEKIDDSWFEATDLYPILDTCMTESCV